MEEAGKSTANEIGQITIGTLVISSGESYFVGNIRGNMLDLYSDKCKYVKSVHKDSVEVTKINIIY